jgi:hypothetical protein
MIKHAAQYHLRVDICPAGSSRKAAALCRQGNLTVSLRHLRSRPMALSIELLQRGRALERIASW